MKVTNASAAMTPPPKQTWPPAQHLHKATSDSIHTTRTMQSEPRDRGGAKPGPLLMPLTAMYGMLHTFILCQMLSLWWAPSHPSHWASSGYLLLAFFELVSVVFTFDSLQGVVAQRFTQAQLIDRFLVLYAGIALMCQLLVALFHPPFLTVDKNWPAMEAFAMGLGVCVYSFPPAHSLVQWVLSSLCFAFLDCFGHAHKQQQCTTAWELCTYFLARWGVVGGSGLVAWLTSYALVVKSSARLSRQAHNMAMQSPCANDTTAGPGSGNLPRAEGPAGSRHWDEATRTHSTGDFNTAFSRALPLESWGLQLPPAVTRLLRWVEQRLHELVDGVHEDVLVRVVCLPIAIYSIFFCLLARMHFQGLSFCSMSPDSFLVFISTWFVLGRYSSNFDIIPLIKLIKASLTASFAKASSKSSLAELVDRVRQDMTGGARAELATGPRDGITVTELLGQGTFGKVYKGVWRGTLVAVKRMVLPCSLNKSERRQRMAIMEAAISSALLHPNIVQTYTYTVKSVHSNSSGSSSSGHADGAFEPSPPMPGNRPPSDPNAAATASGADGMEVQLVLEYMDCGTLRDVLDQGCFLTAAPGSTAPVVNYYAVLETAADVAKGMLHLHSLNVIHSDLKARNVLLRSSASDPRSFIAKVGDFGLSLKMDGTDTHVSSMFQGTATHMAPEVHLYGRQSKAADVYSFGITMWELYTGGRAFSGVCGDLLRHHIASQGHRPVFPASAPQEYASLAARCWDQDADSRPSFEEVLDALSTMLVAHSAKSVSVPRHVPVTVFGREVRKGSLQPEGEGEEDR